MGLRTSLIWHDEVMSDLVHEKPAKVTIGSSGEATFTTPAIGGANEYTIVTPGRRGYLLTLSEQMHGTICVGGVEHDVATFVRSGEEPTGFRATPIGGNDWGVINLDAKGDHKLFFQFVPLEEADWNLGHPMILAAVGGFALSVAALTGLWAWKGVPLGEAAFRAGSLSSLAIGLAATVRWVLKQDNESRASLAFSVMLHAAILFATFQLYERSSPFEWPKPGSVTGGYVVKLDLIQPPKPEPAVAQPTVKPGAAAPAMIPARHTFVRPSGQEGRQADDADHRGGDRPEGDRRSEDAVDEDRGAQGRPVPPRGAAARHRRPRRGEGGPEGRRDDRPRRSRRTRRPGRTRRRASGPRWSGQDQGRRRRQGAGRQGGRERADQHRQDPQRDLHGRGLWRRAGPAGAAAADAAARGPADAHRRGDRRRDQAEPGAVPRLLPEGAQPRAGALG